MSKVAEALNVTSFLLWQILRADDLNLFQQFYDCRGCVPSAVGNGLLCRVAELHFGPRYSFVRTPRTANPPRESG